MERNLSVRHTLPIFGRELDVTVSVDYTCTSPGTPGRTQGDPDDCYPAEGPEIELSSLCAITFPGGYELEFDTDDLPHDTQDFLKSAAAKDFNEEDQ